MQKKARFVILDFFKTLLFVLIRKLSLHFVLFIFRFFKVRNVSTFDYVKTQNFESYDVTMTY